MQLPATPDDSPLTVQDVMQSADYRDLRTPQLAAGDLASDFTLPLLDLSAGKERATGEIVTLSRYRSVSPVALIFGSYT